MASKKGSSFSIGPGGIATPFGSVRACRTCQAWPCRCEPHESLPPERQSPRVRRERAGRKGKTVTVATGIVLEREKAAELLAELKKTCGAGGTLVAARTPAGAACFDLEVQGDHVEKVLEALVARGFGARRAGG